MDSKWRDTGLKRLVSTFVCLILAGALLAPAGVLGLAPKSQLDEEMQAAMALAQILEEFQQRYASGDTWQQLGKKSDKLREDMLAAARRYWKDPTLSLDIHVKDKTIEFPSNRGLLKRDRVYVFSTFQSEKLEKTRRKDAEILELTLGKSLSTPERLGPFHLRGYELGLTRRQFMARSVVSVLASWGFIEASRRVARYLSREKIQAIAGNPIDADNVFVYGPHVVPEEIEEQLRSLTELVTRHLARGLLKKDILIVEEDIPKLGPYRPGFYSKYPWLKDVSDYDLFRDARYDSVLREMYDFIMAERQKGFQDTFEHHHYVLPKHPGRDKAWHYFFQERLRVIPEPLTYEGWKLTRLAIATSGKAWEVLRDKQDLESYVAMKWDAEYVMAKAALLRDKAIGDLIDAERIKNPKIRAFGIRGWSHKFNGIHLRGKATSYAESVPEIFKDEAITLFGGFETVKQFYLGETPDKKEFRYSKVRGLLEGTVRGARMFKDRDLRNTAAYAKQVIRRLEASHDLENWLLKTLAENEIKDKDGIFLIRELVRMGIVDSGEVYLPKVGGMIWPLSQSEDEEEKSPETPTGQSRNQAFKDMQNVFHAYAEENQGLEVWRLPPERMEKEMLDAAKRYWGDTDLLLEFAPDRQAVKIKFSKRIALPDDTTATHAVLSRWETDARKDKEVLGTWRALPEPAFQKSKKDFYVRGYNIGMPRRAILAGLGGGIATVAAIAKGWRGPKNVAETAGLPAQMAKALNADLAVLYGSHENPESLQPLLTIAQSLIDKHKKGDPGMENFVFVMESVPFVSQIYAPGMGFPAWAHLDTLEILENVEFRPVLKRLYERISQDNKRFFEKTFDQKEHAESFAEESAVNECLFEWLQKNKVKVVPEPVSFEGWIDSLRSDFYRVKLEHALENKDMEGFIAYSQKSDKALLSGVKQSDEALAQMRETWFKGGEKTFVLSIRGIIHQETEKVYAGRGYKYESIISNSYRRDLESLKTQILRRMLLGPAMPEVEAKIRYIRAYIQSVIIKGRQSLRGGVMDDHVPFANGILDRLDKKEGGITAWFEKLLQSTQQIDKKGNFVLEELKKKNLLSSGDFAYITGAVARKEELPPAMGLKTRIFSTPTMHVFFTHPRMETFLNALREQGISESTVESLLSLVHEMKAVARHTGVFFEDPQYRKNVEVAVAALTGGKEKAFFQMVRGHLYREVVARYLAGPGGAMLQRHPEASPEDIVNVFALQFENPAPLPEHLAALAASLKGDPAYDALTAGGLEARGDEDKQIRVFNSRLVSDVLYEDAPVETLEGPKPAAKAIKTRLDQLLAIAQKQAAERLEFKSMEPVVHVFPKEATLGLHVHAGAFDEDGRSRTRWDRVNNKIYIDGNYVPFGKELEGGGGEHASAASLKNSFAAAHPSDEILGMMPNGNLGNLDRFAGIASGRVYHYSDEDLAKPHDMLVLLKNGRKMVLSLKFMDEKGRRGAFLADDPAPADILNQIECAVYGQRIVKDGRPHILAAAATEFDDLRHLLRLPMFKVGNDLLHIGFSDGAGELYNKALIEMAVRGEPVGLSATAIMSRGVTGDEIEAAFRRWGYINRTGLKNPADLLPGEFLWDEKDSRITAVYLPGTHPHTVFGLTTNGELLMAAVPGTTHYAGIALNDLAQSLIERGAQDAFLWGNGKDVMLEIAGGLTVAVENARASGTTALFAVKPQVTPALPDAMPHAPNMDAEEEVLSYA